MQTDLSASRPARSRPEQPYRCAPPCSDMSVVCPGFKFDRFTFYKIGNPLIPVDCKIRTYHGRVRAGHRTAGRPGDTGRRGIGSPRGQSFFLPATASKAIDLKDSLEAQTKEMVCEPLEGHNKRLATLLPAVCPQFIRGAMAALRSWFLTSETTFIVFL